MFTPAFALPFVAPLNYLQQFGVLHLKAGLRPENPSVIYQQVANEESVYAEINTDCKQF